MQRQSTRVSWWLAGGLCALMAATAPVAQAQVWAIEGLPWQFETPAAKNSKAVILDIIERKQGGYYDSFQTTYNVTNHVTNNTHIDRQYNCGISATATGSASDNSQQAAVSSPVTTNTSGNSADATGNSSSTDIQDHGVLGALGHGAGASSSDTDQSNTGDVFAGVKGSPSQSSSGRIYADDGHSSQALNVDQTNTGNQTAKIWDSSACAFGSGGVALN